MPEPRALPLRSRRLLLGAMLTGSGAPDDERAWLDPQEPTNASVSPEWYRSIAQLADAGGLDLLFIADAVFVDLDGPPHYLSRFEPLSLLSFLAAATSRVGLVGTFSTSYQQPYNLARMLMSLDLLSSGRAGWNVVTSLGDRAARNFGLDAQEDHATRYERAREALAVVQGLWRSYAPDAFVRDRASGRYLDPERVREIDHVGDFFSVRGPLNIERSTQGEPVIFQAGQSLPGLRLAASSADCVFGYQSDFADARAYREAITAQQRELSVDRPAPKLLLKLVLHLTDPGTDPELALRDYWAKHASLDELASRVARAIERDFDGASPITEHDLERALVAEGTWMHERLAECRTRGEPLAAVLPELARRDRLVMAGPAGHVADLMQRWAEEEATDGFIVQVSSIDGMRRIVEDLIPELRSRAIMPEAADVPRTLREILDLPLAAD